MSELYLGLMSGTSIDGVDVALVDFSGKQPRLMDCQTYPLGQSLADKIHRLCAPSENEIELMGQVDREFAMLCAKASLQLLKDNYVRADQIKAIGSHGQTIRHMPDKQHQFTLQIGDPNTLAALTGIDVVADFRRKDMAFGGQGAPLVPAFHQAVFADPNQSRMLVNIGGIANLTYLPKVGLGNIMGYDTGPGNTLLDAWCRLHTGKPYDDKGQWAAQGLVDSELLAQLCDHAYFMQSPPKSTGRELFNLAWLDQQLHQIDRQLCAQTVQATLVMFTARTLCTEILKFREVEQVYLCGGGAKNEFLVESIESELHGCEVFSTDELQVPSDAVEAMAFAWLAYAHMHKIQGNVPSVTGATQSCVLGTLCPGDMQL